MKIKKYIGLSMPEVMMQIRSELGSEAVILNSKEIQSNGFLGLFKKQHIEVVAALDPEPLVNANQSESMDKQPVYEIPSSQKNLLNSSVLSEIKHLKKVIESQSVNFNTSYTTDYQVVYQYLINQEISDYLAKEIIDAVVDMHEKNDKIRTPECIVRDTQLEIENRLSTVSFQGITYNQKVIHFVGPTGVGKTTTIAKVAANSMLNHRKKIAFITTDTYRIAAIDQLKTYANILDIPIEVAYTLEDYQQAIQKFDSYDLILVDTAGRNFRDTKYIKELTNSLTFGINFKTYLVLSLTSKPKDIIEIHEQFNDLPIEKIIFTKVDETNQYGSILNIALSNEIGIAYLTDGQDVPDDLIKPTSEKISNYIMGRYFDE